MENNERNIDVLFINNWGDNPNKRVYHILNSLNQNGVNSIMIGRKNSTIPRDSKIIFLDVPGNKKTHFSKSSFFSNLVRFVIMIKSIQFIIRFRPKFVYIRDLYLTTFLLLVCNIFKTKVIHESHGMMHKELSFKGKNLKSSIIFHIDNFVFRKSEIIVAITEKLKTNISNFCKQDRIIVIPNGITRKKILAIKERNSPNIFKRRRVIGFVGNWEAWISLEDLLKSSKFLSEEYLIAVVGEGPNLEYYKSQYPKVKFFGRLNKHITLFLMKTFDICVCPWSSDKIFEEKSARKTVEYMSFSKPIIVSNVVGKEDYLLDDFNCLFYNPGDHIDLSRKITNLLEDKKLYKKLSDNSEKTSYDFDWHRLIDNSNLQSVLKDSNNLTTS
tara:strand:- start:288 stop:1442 length:1155 start_codon:yes stop_codon:yes gene_type:complete